MINIYINHMNNKTNYLEKYLKYKNKYLEIKNNQSDDFFSVKQSQLGGEIGYYTTSSSHIKKHFNLIPNKGTQNCGVYLPKDKTQNNKILICNNTQISDIIINFINNNQGIYPKLFAELKTDDNNNIKYYYLWEKLNGDIRDLITNIIPKKYIPIEYYDFFYMKLYYKPQNIYVTDDEEKFNVLNKSNDFMKITNFSINFPLFENTITFCNKVDYQNIIKKLEIINKISNDRYDKMKDNFNKIIEEIENLFVDLFIEISKKMFIMDINGLKYTDLKYDNICYSIDKNGKYLFYLIDPESTCGIKDKPTIYWTPPNIMEIISGRLQDRFSVLKNFEIKPDIFEDFCSPMFNFIILDNNIEMDYNNISKIFGQTKPLNVHLIQCAQTSYTPKKHNIFSLDLDTNEKIKNFIGIN